MATAGIRKKIFGVPGIPRAVKSPEEISVFAG